MEEKEKNIPEAYETDRTAADEILVERKKLPLFSKIFFLVAAVAAVFYLLFLLSEGISDFFNEHISILLRGALAHLTNFIPFSLAEFALIMSPVIFFLLVRLGVRKYSDSWHNVFIYCCTILSIVALIFSLFTFGFAPAYRGSSLDQKLGIDNVEVSAEELYETADILCALLWSEMENISYSSDGASIMPYTFDEMNDKLNEAYATACEVYPFLQKLDSDLKPVMLSEAMSYTHITGVYTFFTGEANINIAFPDYTIPYTAAHELSHQRGIAREDEANFMAFLVCTMSEDPYIRYSGYLNLYEYVSSALYSADRELYTRSRGRLPQAVNDEMAAYSEFSKKYQGSAIGEVSGAVNNTFLIINGTEGTKSYGMVVDLAVAFFKPYFANVKQ